MTESEAGRYRAVEHPNGTAILVLGILSLIACGPLLGPIAWVMANRAESEMHDNASAYWTNRAQIRAGRICAILGTATSLVIFAVAAVVVSMRVGDESQTEIRTFPTEIAIETIAPAQLAFQTPTNPPITASPTLSSKPVVIVPDGTPPVTLQITDIVVGTGPEIAAGDTALVQYVGVGWSTKKEFDASWNPGRTPFEVTNIGQAAVIIGWNEGLIGMRQGGRRQIVIPPEKGYGTTGSGADIAPNETLVFVVDAISVTKR